MDDRSSRGEAVTVTVTEMQTSPSGGEPCLSPGAEAQSDRVADAGYLGSRRWVSPVELSPMPQFQ